MAERLNAEIASRLGEVAELLQEQGANRFRVDAYYRAARLLRNLREPVSEIIRRDGIEALRDLKGIGDSLARSIHTLATTGRLPMLERLRGESDPVALLATVPGIGKVLAERIHDDLGIDSLEELESASHDGRLVEALGEKRLAGIRDSLAARLGRIRRGATIPPAPESPIGELLDVDREYFQKAAKGVLPKIAPRRFNPTHQAWLPVLHTQRGQRHYTALYSNTGLAHRMEKTQDWLVLYYDGGNGERQYTIVTEPKGPLKGKRVVRGREAECENYYESCLEDQLVCPYGD